MVIALLMAIVPEPCSNSKLPLVVCASRTLLVPLTVALMPSPARKVTMPAAWEMMLLELPCWILPTPSGVTKSAYRLIVPVPEAVRLALTSMFRWACRVSELALDQDTGALTRMSPFPSVEASVWMVTEPPPRAVCNVVAPMPLVVWEPEPEAIVKSSGSISHSPPPVLSLKPSSILTAAADVSTNPPLPGVPLPCALISPLAFNSPLICPFSLTMAVTLPPAVPSAPTFEVSVSSSFFVARRKMRPPSSTTLLAFSLPLFLTIAPAMPIRPASAVISPRLVALPSAPVISTLTPGDALSISSTVLPAARMVSPFGVVMMPSFVTLLPIR